MKRFAKVVSVFQVTMLIALTVTPITALGAEEIAALAEAEAQAEEIKAVEAAQESAEAETSGAQVESAEAEEVPATPGSCSIAARPNRVVVKLRADLSSNSGDAGAISSVEEVDLKAGEYRVLIETADSYKGRDQAVQSVESAKVSLLSASTLSPENILATTGATPDLKDNTDADSVLYDTTVTIASPAVAFAAVHAGYPDTSSSNDLEVVCVAFDPIGGAAAEDAQYSTKYSRFNVLNAFAGEENHAPVAYDDFATTRVNTPVTVAVLSNDSDPDGDAISIESYTIQTRNGGTIQKTLSEELRYTPASGFVGTDTFTYVIEDKNGFESNVATVTITIGDQNPGPNPNPGPIPGNRAPVAVDDSATTRKNTPVVIDSLSNDYDPDGDAISIESYVTTTRNGGTIAKVIPSDQVDREQFRYTPATNFVGTDTFTYVIEDDNGFESNVATVTIRISEDGNPGPLPGNHAPVAYDDFATTRVNTPVTVAVLSNDSDPDGDAISIESYTIQTRNGGTIQKTLSEELRYTPASGFVGTDTFTYVIEDKNGFESNVATVTITIRDDGTPPPTPTNGTLRICKVILDENGNISDGGFLSDLFSITVKFLRGEQVFQYDTPLSLNTRLFKTSASNDAECFTRTVALDSEIQYAEEYIRSGGKGWEAPRYNDNFFDDEFNPSTFAAYGASDASDGRMVVTKDAPIRTLVILNEQDGGTTPTPGNRAPVAVDDSATTPKNTPVVIDSLSNDFDPDGDAISIESYVTTTRNGGTIAKILPSDRTDNREMFRYTPATNFVGTDTFTYVIEDKNGFESNVATVTITVTDRQVPPGPTPETGTLRICKIVLDEDGNISTGAGTPGTFTLQITSSSDREDRSFTETFSTPLTLNDNGFAYDTLVRVNNAECHIADSIPLGTYQYSEESISSGDGWETPRYNDEGSFGPNDAYVYGANSKSDGVVALTRANNTQTVLVINQISDDNTPTPTGPDARDDHYTTDEDESITFNVLTNDSGNQIRVTSHTDTSHGGLDQIDENGNFRYTPDNNFEGRDTFRYTITDRNGRTDSATVTIDVDGDNGGTNPPGGGGSPLPPHGGTVRGSRSLRITNERVVRSSSSCALVTWNTNLDATSRVVYGTESRRADTGDDDYGYPRSTREYDFDTRNHTVVICGLDLETRAYYFRPVSDRTDTREVHGIEVNLKPRSVAVCALRIEDYMRIDFANDPMEVLKLQGFLRVFEGEKDVPLSGKFDRRTDAAVRRFQVKYNNDILNPWGYEDDESTGYVYYLTKKKINELLCGRDDVLNRAQLEEIRQFRAYQDSLAARGIDYAGPLVDGPYPWEPEFQQLKRGNYTVPGFGGSAQVATPVPPKVATVEERERDLAERAEEEEVIATSTTETEPADDETLEEFLDEVLGDGATSTGTTTSLDDEEDTSTSTKSFSDKLAGALFAGIDGVMGLVLSIPFLILVLFILVGLLIAELRREKKVKDETPTSTK